MAKKALAAAVLILLSLGLYLFFPKSSYEKPAPEVSGTGGEQQTAGETGKPQTEEREPERTAPAAVDDGTATVSLSPQAHTYLSQHQVRPEVSYSLSEKNKERTIMPGVTYRSGEGVNMVLDEDEKILIRRDSTYRSKEVQVMWKKSF